MAIANPGLSKAAEEALAWLTEVASDKSRRPDASAASLNPVIYAELAAIGQPLDERVDMMPSLRPEPVEAHAATLGLKRFC
ncbi:hypothetical protein CO660_31580 [Rhizobium sp. L9]|uniref:hypothetical protein n=1 Tax=Rhizobium TaxID=379 RepID=UPI000BE998E9|nr:MULTISPECIES: hypothetical protein [Rhizobium]MBB3353325.1 hypothetical protein [Rhizobium sp. BK049]MBX5134776.1 hypothetical protein [Rhizobium lentis]MBX5153718.1 hypothetical protein [Rhizobium lentis]PDT25790.1 hypothetical protein CO660_31580 [Rhizobium sp. L9]